MEFFFYISSTLAATWTAYRGGLLVPGDALLVPVDDLSTWVNFFDLGNLRVAGNEPPGGSQWRLLSRQFRRDTTDMGVAAGTWYRQWKAGNVRLGWSPTPDIFRRCLYHMVAASVVHPNTVGHGYRSRPDLQPPHGLS
jgi:hypothetical protein